jgi:hypothetical protein
MPSIGTLLLEAIRPGAQGLAGFARRLLAGAGSSAAGAGDRRADVTP